MSSLETVKFSNIKTRGSPSVKIFQILLLIVGRYRIARNLVVESVTWFVNLCTQTLFFLPMI